MVRDWTSVSDIGREFLGSVLTLDRYSRVETAYVDVALAFHADVEMPSLFARGIEVVSEDPSTLPDALAVSRLVEDERVPRDRLPVLVRACLRELVWARLEAWDGSCQIHCGYDYYMYLVGPRISGSTLQLAADLGLFVEAFPSPHLDWG